MPPIPGKKGSWSTYDEFVSANGTVIGMGVSDADGHVYYIKKDPGSTSFHNPVRLS
jgi:hypothetical protein